MRIRDVPLPTDILGGLPANERRFFLLAGHIQNECCMFNKILTWCLETGCDGDRPPRQESSAAALQALMIGKHFAAKLVEANSVIRTQYYGTRLSQDFNERLSDDGRAALKNFKKYFNCSSSSIPRIRNNFAFHYSPDFFDDNWERASREDGFKSLIGPSSGNCLHVGSEYVANIGLFNSINPESYEAALKQFLDELFQVSGFLKTFLDSFLLCVFGSRFPGFHDEANDFDLDVKAHLKSVYIPFFVNIDDD